MNKTELIDRLHNRDELLCIRLQHVNIRSKESYPNSMVISLGNAHGNLRETVSALYPQLPVFISTTYRHIMPVWQQPNPAPAIGKHCLHRRFPQVLFLEYTLRVYHFQVLLLHVITIQAAALQC